MTKDERSLLIMIIVSFMMILHFFLMLSVGVITTNLRLSLDLSALQLSLVASSYLYIYILLQAPAGILIDKFGARKVLTIGNVVCAIGCVIFAKSPNVNVAMLGRILNGTGLAFVFVAYIQLAGRWFDRKYFGMMVGFSEFSGMLGAVFGNMLLAVFIHELGWRNSYMLAGGLSLILAFAAWFFIRDYPDNYVINPDKKLTLKKVYADMKFLCQNKNIWLNGVYIALMYEIVTVFSGLWANPFLRQAYSLNLKEATFSCILILVGIGVGSPIAGILCDTYDKKSTTIKACAIVMFVLICIVLYVPILPYWLINILMLALGVSGCSLILSFALVSDMAPEGMKSTTVGITNSVSFSTAVLCQPIVGWILNILARKKAHSGQELYSVTDFRIALTLLPIMILLAYFVSVAISREMKKLN